MVRSLIELFLLAALMAQGAEYPNYYTTNSPTGIAAPAEGWFLSFSNGIPHWSLNGGLLTNVTAIGGPPTGPAGGDLFGTYPNPSVSFLSATNNDLLVSNLLWVIVNTDSQNATNEAMRQATAITNGAILNLSNYSLTISQNATNEALRQAIALTNGAVNNLSNYIATVSANATNNDSKYEAHVATLTNLLYASNVVSGGTLPLSTIPSLPNSSLANSIISFTDGAGIGMSGSPVSLGGTLPLSATTAKPQFGGLGLNTPSQVAGSLWMESDNMFTSPTNGLTLTNGTPATAVAQNQYSPAIYWAAHQWSTGSGGADVTSAFRSFVQSGPGSSPAGIDSTWKIQASRNGGSFSDILTATASSGNGSIVANWTVGQSSIMNWNGRSRMASPADGDLSINASSGSSFNRLILGPIANTWPTLYAFTNASGAILSQSGLLAATNGFYFMQGTNTAPTAATIGGTVGSVTNHVMKNVNGLLIDYWSDGTTLWSKTLAP